MSAHRPKVRAQNGTRRAAAVAAARAAFAQHPYDRVGLRGIASACGLDTGMVFREFGSKEALFAEALASAIPALASPADASWPAAVAAELLGSDGGARTEALRIVANSGASPAVAALIAAQIPALLDSLQANLRPGPDMADRRAVAAALILGFTTTRGLLGFDFPQPEERPLATGLLQAALETVRSGDAAGRRPQAAAGKQSGAAKTRQAILNAADVEFSRLGYDHATVRGIAQAAGADPALVLRHFGSKEGLFREVLRDHFRPREREADAASLPDAMARALAASDKAGGSGGLDITLRSASSATARDIIREDITARFHAPLTRQMQGPHARLRSNLAGSVQIGVRFCTSILKLPQFGAPDGAAIRLLAEVLGAIFADPTGGEAV